MILQCSKTPQSKYIVASPVDFFSSLKPISKPSTPPLPGLVQKALRQRFHPYVGQKAVKYPWFLEPKVYKHMRVAPSSQQIRESNLLLSSQNTSASTLGSTKADDLQSIL